MTVETASGRPFSSGNLHRLARALPIRRSLTLAAALAPLAALAQPKTPPALLAERRTPIVAAVEKAGPAVVNISAERLVRSRTRELAPFFGLDLEGRSGRRYRTESLGSGVVLDSSGIVVTNDHVVSGASRIIVTTSDGRELEAEVKGADADNDLAVLTAGGDPLPAARLGTTRDLMIGETVIAIGNPFGLSNTVTAGIVSAVHRSVQGESGRTYSDFIQTDAAINPGNSGGALVNVLGELIGINTAIVGGANTIGFAIPVDRVKRIADELVRFGQVKPVWLGLRGTTVVADSDRPSSRGRGLRVRSVYPGSPAGLAGLLRGDVIVALDGRPIQSREDFDTALTSVGAGRSLALTYRRQGQEHTAEVTTARAPEDLGLQVLRRDLGLSVSERRSGLTVGSVVPGSPADIKGLERGDLILGVNNQKVATLDDLSHAVEAGFGRSALVLVVARGAYAYNVSLPLD